MVENSSIEWTDHTFNPWIGCTHVSPACDHCYAEALSKARLGVLWGPGEPRRRTKPSTWAQPLAWDRRAAREGRRYRVFCASLADVFDNEVPAEWRADLFALIRQTPNLDWLLLTKRIGNATKMIDAAGGLPDNVWLGATVVNQDEVDRDVPKLLATPSRVRFLSMEPLLGPVDLTRVFLCEGGFDAAAGSGWESISKVRFNVNALLGAPSIGWGRLDWIIVGGESGPGARPMHPDWARSLRNQCAAAGVPFLFKQWGEWLDHETALDVVGQDNPLVGDSQARFQARHDRLRYLDGLTTIRVGKKAAGRLLDGIEHNGVPA